MCINELWVCIGRAGFVWLRVCVYVYSIMCGCFGFLAEVLKGEQRREMKEAVRVVGDCMSV